MITFCYTFIAYFVPTLSIYDTFGDTRLIKLMNQGKFRKSFIDDNHFFLQNKLLLKHLNRKKIRAKQKLEMELKQKTNIIIKNILKNGLKSVGINNIFFICKTKLLELAGVKLKINKSIDNDIEEYLKNRLKLKKIKDLSTANEHRAFDNKLRRKIRIMKEEIKNHFLRP